MAMNLVVLTGRLVSDPEVKYTQNSKTYARIVLAIPRKFNKEEVDYITVTAWDKKAELIAQYLKKGSLVGVSGSLRTRTYEDNGKKVKIMEVSLENIEFLDAKGASAGGSKSYESKGGYEAKKSYEPKNTRDDSTEEGFPF